MGGYLYNKSTMADPEHSRLKEAAKTGAKVAGILAIGFIALAWVL